MKMKNVKLYKTTDNRYLPNEQILIGDFNECEMYEEEEGVFLEIVNQSDVEPREPNPHTNEVPIILEITSRQGETKLIKARKSLTEISPELIKIKFTVL
ncbi:hypothetical protein MOD13_04750 [Bacillus vallismortis]|uniref:hypothetical protein n=1 Tax=Bacillus vallismortis TaxID=72361 RepID=UPI00227ED3E1|nr:hypothetical protein [Bacillus vallismortis]MCY8532673.1 hypothetical protein [Bacillus vallismortis]